jgi:hypothetical protein
LRMAPSYTVYRIPSILGVLARRWRIGEPALPRAGTRYGWINRALPPDELAGFVSALARRIAKFPPAGHALVKDRVNAIALAPVDDFRHDSDLFAEAVRAPAAQRRIAAAMKRGLKTRDAELGLARMLGELPDR